MFQILLLYLFIWTISWDLRRLLIFCSDARNPKDPKNKIFSFQKKSTAQCTFYPETL